MNKKYAIVMSGGGAKGAFQVGALQFIHEVILEKYKGELEPLVYSGVSVGCLNATMLGQDKYKTLLDVWRNLDNDQVYTGQVKVLPAVWRILRGKKGILSYEPLDKLVRTHIKKNDFVHRTLIGAVSLVDGKYYSYSQDDFADDKTLQDGVLASSLMPVFWEPIRTLKSKKGDVFQAVDGGLRNNSPLKDVLVDENAGGRPDVIFIINYAPFSFKKEKPLIPNEKAADNIFNIAKRSLVDIALNEVFLNDLQEFLRINHLVKQAGSQNVTLTSLSGRPLKYFKPVLISPVIELGDALDFGPEMNKKRWNHGYEAAKAAFHNFNINDDSNGNTNLSTPSLTL
ncbi:patatin-like phospholipase family protein [Roseivirga sp. BDSF3-8]|uniref:patatin-like phospholipase family protein n=1 Tax=Roseivirga sp. BDSF3-8 TaxID=3241598 RepID=UPI0035325181